MLPNDPNGYTWPHEPKCPSCLKFDADCKCTAADAVDQGIRTGRVGKWNVEHGGDWPATSTPGEALPPMPDACYPPNSTPLDGDWPNDA